MKVNELLAIILFMVISFSIGLVTPRTDVERVIFIERFKRAYDIDDWNCLHMSQNVKKILDSKNYTSTIMVGCEPNNLSDCHAWIDVVVSYDATSAWFLDKNDYVNIDILGVRYENI